MKIKKASIFTIALLFTVLFGCQEQTSNLKQLEETSVTPKKSLKIATLNNKIIEVHGTLRLVGSNPYFVYVVSDNQNDYYLDIPASSLKKYQDLQNKKVKVVGKLIIMKLTTPNKQYTVDRLNIQVVSLEALL